MADATAGQLPTHLPARRLPGSQPPAVNFAAMLAILASGAAALDSSMVPTSQSQKPESRLSARLLARPRCNRHGEREAVGDTHLGHE